MNGRMPQAEDVVIWRWDSLAWRLFYADTSPDQMGPPDISQMASFAQETVVDYDSRRWLYRLKKYGNPPVYPKQKRYFTADCSVVCFEQPMVFWRWTTCTFWWPEFVTEVEFPPVKEKTWNCVYLPIGQKPSPPKEDRFYDIRRC